MTRLRCFLLAACLLAVASTAAHATYPTVFGLAYKYEHPTSVSTVSDCNDCGQVVSLPFPFRYYGETFTSVTVSDNGFVVLGDNLAAARASQNLDPMRYWAGNDINPQVAELMIAPLWDNWNPSLGGDVYYGTAASGAFVVEWSQVVHNDDMSKGTYSFLLKLQPSGQFEFHYVKMYGKDSSLGCTTFDCGYSAHGGYTYRTRALGTLTHWPKDPKRSLHPLYAGQAFGYRAPADNTIYFKAADTAVDRVTSYVKATLTWQCSDGTTMTVGTTTNSSWQGWGLYCSTASATPVLASAKVTQTSSWSQIWIDPIPFFVPPVDPANPVAKDTPTPSTAHRFLRLLTWPKPERKSKLLKPPNPNTGASETSCTADSTPPGSELISFGWYSKPGLSWMDSECPAGTQPRAAWAQRLYDFSYYGKCVSGTCQFYSIRDWYRGSDDVRDKVLLVVPGIDALNSDSSVIYYDLLNKSGLLGRFLNEGWDVVIGDYADGNRKLEFLAAEVDGWIRDVNAETDLSPLTGKRYLMQVAGVSQGGVLLRQAIAMGETTLKDMVQAWYSVDSPQQGASLGSGVQGLGTLLRGNYSSYDWRRVYYESPPSRQMVYEVCDTFHDATWPENWWCDEAHADHDAFYKSTLKEMPTLIPHYALVFGDVNPGHYEVAYSGGYRARELFRPRGKMFDWTYSSGLFNWNCDADQQWYSDKRDCVPGANYLTSDVVNTSQGIFWDSYGGCSGLALKLMYKPAFIPVHSALNWQGMETSILGQCEGTTEYACYSRDGWHTGTCTPGNATCTSFAGEPIPPSECFTTQRGYRLQVDPGTQWTGWAGNQGNWPHCAVSPYLAEKLYNWVTGSTVESQAAEATYNAPDITCFQ